MAHVQKMAISFLLLWISASNANAQAVVSTPNAANINAASKVMTQIGNGNARGAADSATKNTYGDSRNNELYTIQDNRGEGEANRNNPYGGHEGSSNTNGAGGQAGSNKNNESSGSNHQDTGATHENDASAGSNANAAQNESSGASSNKEHEKNDSNQHGKSESGDNKNNEDEQHSDSNNKNDETSQPHPDGDDGAQHTSGSEKARGRLLKQANPSEKTRSVNKTHMGLGESKRVGSRPMLDHTAGDDSGQMDPNHLGKHDPVGVPSAGGALRRGDVDRGNLVGKGLGTPDTAQH